VLDNFPAPDKREQHLVSLCFQSVAWHFAECTEGETNELLNGLAEDIVNPQDLLETELTSSGSNR
jgi:hypothetical protein